MQITRISNRKLGGISAILLVFMVLITATLPLLVSNLISRPVSVDPLAVKADIGKKGCIMLVLEDRDLVFNGKRLSGNIIVSFGGEFHTISITEFFMNRAIVCFSEGYERERERIIKRYAELGVTVGASGREVIKRLVEKGVAAYTLPAVTITIWLYDDEGYDYIYSESISSLHYYLSRGYEYLSAFEKAFEDPLAVVREGITVTIPPIRELSMYLARINKKPALESVLRELGILNNTFRVVTGSSLSTLAERGEVGLMTIPGSSGVIPNYWNYPTSPDQFWRNRISAPLPSEEEYVENVTWQKFIENYGSAYLFSKALFSSPSDVRNYLNSVPGDTYGCFKEGIKEITMVLNLCLLPSYWPYSITWNYTKQPGTNMYVFKPFIIQVISSRLNPPSLILTLSRGSFQGGYNKHGWTFLGVLIGTVPEYSVTSSVRSVLFTVPGDWLVGRRYAAISVWTRIKYYYDALILTYDIRQYWGDPNYWVAIPIATMLPYYIEEEEFSGSWWDISWFDILGNCIAGTCWVSNINSLIQEWSGIYNYENKLYYYLVTQNTHDQIPTYDVVIDEISGNEAIVGSNCAGVLLGASLSLLSLLFEVALPSVSPAVSIFLSVLGTFIGYADQTFYFSVSTIVLEWRRSPIDPPQPSVKIKVEKLTQLNAASNVLNIVGKPPLVVMYRVIIE